MGLLLDNKRRDIYLHMSYEQEEVSLAFIIPSSLRLLIIAITNDSLPHFFFILLRSIEMANLTLSPVSMQIGQDILEKEE